MADRESSDRWGDRYTNTPSAIQIISRRRLRNDRALWHPHSEIFDSDFPGWEDWPTIKQLRRQRITFSQLGIQHSSVLIVSVPQNNGIEDHTVGGVIPRQFLAACRKGVDEALQDGVVGGYTVVDVAVELIDGQAHAKDSNELAFRMAAIFAVKDALRQAGAILLEPIMAVECVAPDEYRGDLLGDHHRSARERASRL